MQRQTLLQGLEAMPGDASLLVALGSLLEQEADWSTLREVLLEHLPRVPRGGAHEGKVYYFAAKACLELGDCHQAVRLATRAVQLLPDFPYAHHILGRALVQIGRRQEALRAQQRCAELAPAFPWCWFEIGIQALALNDPATARSALQVALQRQQDSDPDAIQIFRKALGEAERACRWGEREAAARRLWPERPVPAPDAPLPPLERLALLAEEFHLFLDRLEASPQPEGKP